VALTQREDVLVHRLELLHDPHYKNLTAQIIADIQRFPKTRNAASPTRTKNPPEYLSIAVFDDSYSVE
jgi:sigma54-dependent transcription regulator